jgi:transmembrane sensor
VSNLLPFPNPNSRLEKEEAGQWLARLDRGLTPAEHNALSEWLQEPRRRQTLFHLARNWDNMAILEELAELFPLPETEGFPRRFAGAAVVLLSVIGAASTLFYVRAHDRSTISTPVAMTAPSKVTGHGSFSAEYATPIGQHRTVELPDTSEIQLNTNTRLRVEYSATARVISMSRGEAMFEVAKDPTRPFTVRYAGYDFKAVGTAFNVRTDSHGCLHLTVTEGRVRVHRTPSAELQGEPAPPPTVLSEATDILVEANKAVSIGPKSERIDALSPDQVAAETAWQHGVVVFKATPLAQVVEELARYSTVRLVISEPQLARLPVSGYFEVGDIDSLSAALEQNVGIKITRQDGYLLLSSTQPPHESPGE